MPIIENKSASTTKSTKPKNEKHNTTPRLMICDKCLFARQKIMGKIGYQSKSTQTGGRKMGFRETKY